MEWPTMMKWRKIYAHPESMTGTLVKEMKTFFGIITKNTVVRAYTRQDVMDFYFEESSKAFKQAHCDPGEFHKMNKDFMEATQRIAWPVEDIRCLGKLWVPISDEQLEFEALEPFLKLGYFETYTFEQQLIVLKFVGQETKTKLLAEVSKQRQLKLLEAVTAPFEKKEEEAAST